MTNMPLDFIPLTPTKLTHPLPNAHLLGSVLSRDQPEKVGNRAIMLGFV